MVIKFKKILMFFTLLFILNNLSNYIFSSKSYFHTTAYAISSENFNVSSSIECNSQNLSTSTRKICTNSSYINDSNIGEKYYKSDRLVEMLKIIMSFLIPALILFSGFSSTLSNFAKKISNKPLKYIGIYGILYTLLDSLLIFPLNFYASYTQSHIFGFSHQPLTAWIKNYCVELILNLLIVFFVLWIPYKIIKNHPKRWWIYIAILSIPITSFSYLAQPILIDPLFNKFRPLENTVVESSLLNLSKKAGIKNCKIIQIDKSSETNMMNAYMTGIGKSQRIVLWDTTLNKLNLRELNFITAHEIGHYVLGHINHLLIINITLNFIVLYIISLLAIPIINKHKKFFKFDKLHNPASYPLAIIIINTCFLFITPCLNIHSCYTEREADKYALELTQDKNAAIDTFTKLKENGISIPNPNTLYKVWKYDHPTIDERIDFFKSYKLKSSSINDDIAFKK